MKMETKRHQNCKLRKYLTKFEKETVEMVKTISKDIIKIK